ncbi:MAG: saccharopine dehydrogenase C-terminal domain-containing protein [Chitinophagaceae bacterium]
MTKNIVLFGAGKSASFLIKYLEKECSVNNWNLIVADNNLPLAQSKVGLLSNAIAIGIEVENQEQRSNVIKEADLVISLLPPALHYLVASDCVLYGKNLLTASYLDEKIMTLAPDIKSKGLLFLCEMGLDPGIDHMSAVKLIHEIKKLGGEIVSFKSHCGGLLAPESDDNPWHYKMSWNPRNVVMAGSSGATFREENLTRHLAYEQLFHDCKEVAIPHLGQLAYYPNRDSLMYMKLYDLENTPTFLRTTLRYPVFCRGWNSIVNAGLTNDKDTIDTRELSFRKWSEPSLPFVDAGIKKQLAFLGLYDNQAIPDTLKTSADILQYLLEKNLMMKPSDKDMVVMLHEIEYNLKNVLHKTTSLLLITGEDSVDTAMAKTVGLPLGIAARLILQEKILVTGLHIPVIPEIYAPVLQELKRQGVSFEEKDSVQFLR